VRSGGVEAHAEDEQRARRDRRGVAEVHTRGLDALVVDEVRAVEPGLLRRHAARVQRHRVEAQYETEVSQV